MVSNVVSDHKPGLLWSLMFLVITTGTFMVSNVLSDHNRDFYGL